MKRRLLFYLTLAWMLPAAIVRAQSALTAVEQALDLSHPVASISAGELGARLATQDSAALVFFDVRKAEEFDTSHLAHAIHVGPGLSAESFLERYGALIEGKDLVLYCSVGYRSSILLERIRSRADGAGARSVSNLRGGIFRWYNDGHAVVDSTGETDHIHPYDSIWGRLIEVRHRTDGTGSAEAELSPTTD